MTKIDRILDTMLTLQIIWIMIELALVVASENAPTFVRIVSAAVIAGYFWLRHKYPSARREARQR